MTAEQIQACVEYAQERPEVIGEPDEDPDCTDCCVAILLADGHEPSDPPLCHACEKGRLEKRIAELQAVVDKGATVENEAEAHFQATLNAQDEMLAAQVNEARAGRRKAEEERDEAMRLLHTPELHDFASGVVLEAAHQRDRWASVHDEGKSAADWFWLLGHLAGKAVTSATHGDVEKTLHHVITSAAVLANWHAAITGASNVMRPGIEPPKEIP